MKLPDTFRDEWAHEFNRTTGRTATVESAAPGWWMIVEADGKLPHWKNYRRLEIVNATTQLKRRPTHNAP